MGQNRKIKKNCIECNKEFSAVVYNGSKGIVQKFCGRSCKITHANRQRVWKSSSIQKSSLAKKGRYEGANNPNYKAAFTPCKCINCGIDFNVPNTNIKSKKHSGKYCSLSCYMAYRSGNAKPEIYKRLYKLYGRNISKCLKTAKNKSKWTELVGYSINELRSHLEKQFKDGMSWDNYGRGGWNIDHIRPLSWFNFNSFDDEDFKKAWSLNNLQPLWEKDNYQKGNRYEG